MKKNFTKLVCVGIACFYMASAMAQVNKPVERMVEEHVLQKQNEIELRANDVTGYFWPDSIEFYNSAGERTSVDYYDKENRKMYYAHLSNGSWELSDSYDSDGFFLSYQKVRFYEEGGSQKFAYPSVRPNWLWSFAYKQDYKFNTVYDNKDNLILVEIKTDAPYDGTYNFIEYHIKYNENNNPVLIEAYNYNRLFTITRYEYNTDGYMTLLEYLWNNDGKLEIGNSSLRETAKFDEQGRPVEMRMYRGSESTNGWLLDSYWLFYYSDVKIENNNPVGNDNQGSFDLEVNIPTDSISNGSITITFPEGFTLDENNTSLTLDFADLFDLIITKQDNNSWLFEIKPKTLKSATLRADEVKKMLHVAYTVDEKLLQGAYDISVHSILFETKGGNYIPEPAITVTSMLERWGVINEKIESNGSMAYLINQTLYIQSEKADRISIYSITGKKLYEIDIQPGTNTIPTSHFPQGILLVKGSSGWVSKVVNNN